MEYTLRSQDPAVRRAIFSLRYLKYFFCWLLLWQDGMIYGSPIQIHEYLGRIPSVEPVEIIAMCLGLLVLFERCVLEDFRIRRSYFSLPLLLIGVALFISWSRGVFINQRWAPVLEMHEAFEWPFAFLLLSNAFRDPEEYPALFMVLMGATLPKAVDGLLIYFLSTDSRKSWGVIQMWRDGYLLGLGVVATMLLLHYDGEKLRKFKRLMIAGIPVLGFTLLMSYRRTFIVASLVSAILMIFTLGKGRRKKQLAIIGGLLVIMVIVAIFTDPMGLLGRLSGIIEPAEEGSAYIRLMELPNVIRNIIDNPIFGTAVGTQWKQYYRMPVSAVYTTFGTHNTYLYWPLRSGLLGTIGFWFLLARTWKSVLINHALQKTKEDFVYTQLSIHMVILYQVACLFGLMYGDAMATFMAVFFTVTQLYSRSLSGRYSYAEVALWPTMKAKRLVFKPGRVRQIPSVAPVHA